MGSFSRRAIKSFLLTSTILSFLVGTAQAQSAGSSTIKLSYVKEAAVLEDPGPVACIQQGLADCPAAKSIYTISGYGLLPGSNKAVNMNITISSRDTATLDRAKSCSDLASKLEIAPAGKTVLTITGAAIIGVPTTLNGTAIVNMPSLTRCSLVSK